MSKRIAPFSMRLTPEMKARLEEAAAKIGISPHSLAQLAVEAGVSAVEEADSIAMPIKFQTTHVVVPRGSALRETPGKPPPPANPARQAGYPAAAGEEIMRVEDKPGPVVKHAPPETPTQKKRSAGLTREEQQ